METINGPAFRIKSWVNRRVFCNRRLEGLIWKLYYSRDRLAPAVPISAEAAQYLQQFRAQGVVVLPGRFPELADHLDREYFTHLQGRSEHRSPWFLGKVDFGERGAANRTILPASRSAIRCCRSCCSIRTCAG